MESVEFYHAKALLEWQVELGVLDAIQETPVDRYKVPVAVAKPTKVAAPEAITRGVVAAVEVDAVAAATAAAEGADTLEALRDAMSRFDLCELKKGARNLVFADGVVGANVMLIGEAPNRDEDREGRPFVGAAGQLLDKMLDAIDMGRTRDDAPIYLSSVLPWRPPQNRDPKPEEIAMMKPFLLRHIELAKPEVLVILGNWACQSLLGKRGITRLRGEWTQVAGLPALPMFHPAYLLRSPEFKREAWADLLSLKAHLRNDLSA